MLCHRGCGLIATYTNYKGLGCCSSVTQHCPAVKKKIGEKNSIALAGRTLTKEHRSNISKGLERHSVSDIAKQRNSISNKKFRKENPRDPWNKGLSIADPRVAAYANKQRGAHRAKRIKVIPSDDPIYNDIKKYRNRIAVRTARTYADYKEIINPLNLPLGKAGVSGAHHIDHIMSVREAFEYSVPVELVSAKDNLRVIPWQENNSKYSKVDYNIVPESIKQYIKEKE